MKNPTDWSCPDSHVLLGDRQLQGSFTLFHVCRAQDAELRPLFGLRKRPSAARSVFHMVAELLKNVQGA